MATSVVGLFDNQDAAQAAVRDLIENGFRRTEISVVAADPQGELYRRHVDEEGTIAGEGAATGLTSGAVVGGVLGLLIGAGLIFVPAGVLAAGPIAGLIAGGAAGAATGGILGGLIGLGIPKEEADIYAEGVRRGGTIISVLAEEEDVARAHQILDREGAVDIDERSELYRAQGFTGYDPDAPATTAANSPTEPTSISGAERAFPSDPVRSRTRQYPPQTGAYADNPPEDQDVSGFAGGTQDALTHDPEQNPNRDRA